MTSSAFERRYSHYHSHREKTPARHKSIPLALKIGITVAVIALTLWSGASAFYLFFRDDALRMLVSHQTNLVRSYDAQIAGLQTQVQRLQSLKLVEQERVDRTVAELAKKQAIVEQRQNALTNLAPKSVPSEAPRDRGLKGRVPDTFPVLERTPKPSPISDVITSEPSRQRSAKTDSALNFAILDRSRPIADRLHDLSTSLAAIETRQQQTLDRFADTLSGDETRAQSVLLDLGIVPPQTKRAIAIGGPFIPFLKADPFDQKLGKAQEAAAGLGQIEQVLQAMPVRFPVPRKSEVTSPFGVRADPFLHQLALHSGVDFRGSPGEMVRATAGGRVTNAGTQGGYGMMVEIDHGNGLVTRYGHLAAVETRVGAEVQAGDVVGLVGSTGRSTGPHLHYEVRVAGEAVDPMRYLRAGERLDGIESVLSAVAAPSNSTPKTQLISTD